MAEAPETSDHVSMEISAQDRLSDLIAQATASYAVKDYSPAAELYSQATELQAEMNGEMAIENADLLYSYGKCLYFVAVRNSEVLGGGAAGAKMGGKSEVKQSKKRKANGEPSSAAHSAADTPTTSNEHGDSINLQLASANGTAEPIPGTDVRPGPERKSPKAEDKPYFTFEGDGDFGESDSDGEDANAEEQEEEEDDFANAFEVLDLSRVLLLRKLDHIQENTLQASDKGKYVASIDLTPEVREVKERIADVHDLQAEISLEGEKFPNAVVDLKAALALKEELYPTESSVLAECHYKLSLALEFSSVSQQHDADGNPVGDAQIDKAMREEAATQMERAIKSCKLRVAKEERELNEIKEPGKKDKAMRNIEDVREMVADMEQRLVELLKPPIDVNKEQSRLQGIDTAGILKDILGGTTTLEDVTQKANDLSGMVKRKKPKADGASGTATPEPSTNLNMNSKRKVGFADEAEEAGPGKKAKVEDADDSGL